MNELPTPKRERGSNKKLQSLTALIRNNFRAPRIHEKLTRHYALTVFFVGGIYILAACTPPSDSTAGEQEAFPIATVVFTEDGVEVNPLSQESFSPESGAPPLSQDFTNAGRGIPISETQNLENQYSRPIAANIFLDELVKLGVVGEGATATEVSWSGGAGFYVVVSELVVRLSDGQPGLVPVSEVFPEYSTMAYVTPPLDQKSDSSFSAVGLMEGERLGLNELGQWEIVDEEGKVVGNYDEVTRSFVRDGGGGVITNN